MNEITYDQRRAVYEKAIKWYGGDHQRVKAIEEMAELICELSRVDLCRTTPEKLTDEIADVTIMCEQLRLIFGINDAVSQRMDYKVRRLAGWLDG